VGGHAPGNPAGAGGRGSGRRGSGQGTYCRWIDVAATSRRPAHRPSRRNLIVDGAIDLFATVPVDEVTVLDIANAVSMTPAAVYYHFASKEQILLEGLERFRDALFADLGKSRPVPHPTASVRSLLTQILGYCQRHRQPALVYFVNSIGLNLQVEALRRATRLELVELIRPVVKRSRGRLGGAEAGVIAVGLVSLIETSAASMLNQDASYRALGARRFAEQVCSIGERIAGIAHP
jgi:AcrR family transcriptional regulator